MNNFPDAMRFDPYANGLGMGHTDLATAFLGPNPRPEQRSPYSMKSTAKWNMPESYVNENLYLKDTVEDWMFTANWTWYTERILPWKRMEDIHVKWEQWEANPHIMGMTPHQSMSNVITQKRVQMAASMIRRGIAAEFEQDFLNTSVGRGRFVAALAQIARSVQETANVEVIKALLGCHRHQQLFARQYHIIKDNELDNYWQRKVDRFMIAQKEDFGLETLGVQIDGELETYNVKANVWIMGREVSDYCDTVPEGKIYYYKGGQEAVNRINGRGGNTAPAAAGTQGNLAAIQPERLVKGTPVFLAKSWSVENVGKADLLSRTVEVGVFNTMLCKCRDFRKFKTADMNIRVYDNNKDDWAEITFEKALQHCISFDKNDDDDVMDPFTGNARRRNVGDTDHQHKMDFLRYSTGNQGDNKQDVKYIGDLDEDWLTVKQTLNAAQTLLNQIKDGTAGDSTIGKAVIDKKTEKVTTETSATFKVNDKTTAFIQKAGNILGGDSLFFKGALSDKDGKPRNLLDLFTNNGAKYGVTALTSAPIQSDVSTVSYNRVEAEQKHQTWLKSIGSIVPENRQADLNAIVTNSDEGWKQRALNIQSLVLECKKSDPPSINMNEARIKTWMEGRINEYQTNFTQWVNSQASSPVGASSSGVGKEVIYLPVGTPLPSGYTYLNAQEEAKAKGPAEVSFRCPTSLAEFTYISEVFESPSGGGGAQRGVGIAGRRGASLVGARGDGSNTEYGKGRGEYDADGNPITDKGAPNSRTDLRLSRRFTNINKRIRDISMSGASIELKWLAILYLGTRFNKRRFAFLADQDVLLPVQFLLMRPHCTYRTRYAIKCADGGVTGFFGYGHGSMNVAHAATTKTRLLHFTAYMAPIITNPKSVYVCEDVFCENYFGGMGTDFWTADEYRNKGANRIKKSIICTLLPLNLPYDLETKIDIRGYWYSAAAARLVDAERFAKGCYPGGDRTAAILDIWDPVRKGALNNQVARARNVAVNYVCFQGVQFSYNSVNETWGNVVIEQGHFGPSVQPGDGKVRKGMFKYLRRAKYLDGTSN